MANATVDHANLANNAFSNFAPLLTLFGEEVTKQFIATSTGIPDSLLLSVAPIGLMTIIVSAIRVGGNRFMKSIIGRARESPNEQEKEILPSTSANVHEIWDGSRVVRQTGPSITKLFCFDPPQLKLGDRARRSLPKRQLNYLLSPEDALSSYGDQQLYGIAPIFQRYFGQAIGKHSLPCLDGIPPNLTLNSTTLDRRLTVVFTAAGLLVQLSVMLINALVVYRWRWLRAGRLVAAYGYPTWAAGTASITMGTFLCGLVIDSCRWIYRLRLDKEEERSYQTSKVVVFVQKAMPEQNIPAYAIRLLNTSDGFFLSFRRSPPLPGIRMTSVEILMNRSFAAVGAALYLAGFVAQNVGTRELHWSAGVLQLGATLLLTFLRAWLRRDVDAFPTENSKITRLDPGLEACQLVAKLTGCYCYLPVIFSDGVPAIYDGSGDAPSEKRRSSSQAPRNVEAERSAILKRQPTWLWSHSLNSPKDSTQPKSEEVGERTLVSQGNSQTEPLSEIELKEIAIAMLEMHASLLDCDADTKQLKSLATRCLKTMKDVLRILQIRKDNGAGEDVDVCDLGDFLYMQIHDALDPSKQMHSSVVQVGFPVRNSRDHFAAHTGFLSAVIGYTRYIYDEKVRQRSGAGGMSTIRILGHCTPHNAEAYVKSLREWTGMRGDELFHKLYLHLETSDDWSTVPIPSSGLGSTVLLFGLPLSHRFRASERTEAYYSSMYELQFINYAPYQHNIEGNIVLEIILAFFLRVIDMYRNEVTEFLRCNPKDRCQALADILIKHDLCNSAEQARLAIVPALLNHGCLNMVM